jgi:F-type H+-transporting ATPase subunit c
LFEGRRIPEPGEIISASFDFYSVCNCTQSIWSTTSDGETSMRKLRILFFALVGMLMTAMPVLAQAPVQEVDNTAGLKAIAAGIGFAIAVFGGALGQSRIGAAACEGAARNPGASAKIQTMMILGLALIESLVLFALVIVFVKT